jgi:hypothetical protein
MPSTTWHVATQTTSAAVQSVNQTGEAMFGRPFVVTHRFGYAVEQPVVVLTGNNSATVHASSFTTDTHGHPDY